MQMPASEIYNALQTGLIDGVLTGSSAIGDFKLDEVANSYTLGAPLGHIAFYLVMNADRYNGLSAEHKAAIDANSRETLSKIPSPLDLIDTTQAQKEDRTDGPNPKA